MERDVLKGLVHHTDYWQRVFPFLKEEYFHDAAEKEIFKVIKGHSETYNRKPTLDAIRVELGDLRGVNEGLFQEIGVSFDEISQPFEEKPDLEWLTDKTEDFCKKQAYYNAVMDAANVASDPTKFQESSVRMEDALSVSFSVDLGHDLFDDWEKRFEWYTQEKIKKPFAIGQLNTNTNGGILPGTLTIFVAGTNVGKSFNLCNEAASDIVDGRNVLYVTAEMGEIETSQRVESNILDIDINSFRSIDKDFYKKRLDRLRGRTHGKLKIKQFPTGEATVRDIRRHLVELKRAGFTPDVIYVDYLNLFSSTRIKLSAAAGTYLLVKVLSEEFRALAIQHKVPIVTATQTNRGGQVNTDPSLEDVSESHGISMTADYIYAMARSEDMDEMPHPNDNETGYILFKVLKQRYDRITIRRFVARTYFNKMRIVTAEDSEGADVMNGGEVKRQDVQSKFFEPKDNAVVTNLVKRK